MDKPEISCGALAVWVRSGQNHLRVFRMQTAGICITPHPPNTAAWARCFRGLDADFLVRKFRIPGVYSEVSLEWRKGIDGGMRLG